MLIFIAHPKGMVFAVYTCVKSGNALIRLERILLTDISCFYLYVCITQTQNFYLYTQNSDIIDYVCLKNEERIIINTLYHYCDCP